VRRASADIRNIAEQLADTGSVLGTSEWDAWGTQRSGTGSGYAFGWAGEQFDASSDLTYLRARFYSPGYNPYTHAISDSVTAIDCKSCGPQVRTASSRRTNMAERHGIAHLGQPALFPPGY